MNRRRLSAAGLTAAAIALAVNAGAHPASAAGTESAAPAILSVAAIQNGSTFTDDRGNSYPVTSTVTNTLLSTDADGTRHYALTVADAASIPGYTPSRPAGAVALSASTTGGCDNDASYIVKMCLTQYYSQSGNYVEVDKYTASWLRLDNQFAFSSASVLAGVNGACRSDQGCGTKSDRQSWSHNPPGNGTTYTQVPRWHGIYTLVDSQASKFQCANSTVHMTRGSGRYTFTHRNVGEGGCGLG